MPARRVLLLLALLLMVTASSTLVVRAGSGATAEELRAKAEGSYGMYCYPGEGSWSCGNWPLSAEFQPDAGQVTHLVVRSDEFSDDGMSPEAEAMMVDFVDAVCLDPDGVSGFVAKVASLTTFGQVSPAELQTCSLTGGLEDPCELDCYWVDAVAHEPTPTPTPSPTPAPTATPSPSPLPTPSPTPGQTSSASPTASASGSPTATASGSASATSSASPSMTPSPIVSADESVEAGASGSPSPTEEQQVAGGNPSPTPGSDQGAPIPPGGPGGFARSVPTLDEVSNEPLAIGGSALLAMLLMLFVAFPGELFNDTVESNFDEIAGWFRRGPFGGVARVMSALPRGPIAIAAFVALAAFLNALLDPGLGVDTGSLATYLGFLVALVVTLVAFDGPPLLVHRRRTGELGSMRVLPWTLLIVAVFVAVSRAAALQPGYLYGIVLGTVFVREDAPAEEGREQAAGAAWTLGVAMGAWLLLGWLRSASPEPSDFIGIAVQTALAAVMVAGIEAVALGMVPFRFLPGAAVYRWSRVGWAALFGIGAFAFAHVLIGPNIGYVSELSVAGLAAAAAAFVAFGVISLAVWGYFRFRPAHASG